MSTPWYMFPVTQGHATDAGIDLGTPNNTPLTFPWSGTVVEAGYRPWGGEVIASVPGLGLEYFIHLNQIAVQAGQAVGAGQVVGTSGGGIGDVVAPHGTPQIATSQSDFGAYSTGYHTEFGVFRGTQASDWAAGWSDPGNRLDPTPTVESLRTYYPAGLPPAGAGGVGLPVGATDLLGNTLAQGLLTQLQTLTSQDATVWQAVSSGVAGVGTSVNSIGTGVESALGNLQNGLSSAGSMDLTGLTRVANAITGAETHAVQAVRYGVLRSAYFGLGFALVLGGLWIFWALGGLQVIRSGVRAAGAVSDAAGPALDMLGGAGEAVRGVGEMRRAAESRAYNNLRQVPGVGTAMSRRARTINLRVPFARRFWRNVDERYGLPGLDTQAAREVVRGGGEEGPLGPADFRRLGMERQAAREAAVESRRRRPQTALGQRITRPLGTTARRRRGLAPRRRPPTLPR